jgi:YfiH family protein
VGWLEAEWPAPATVHAGVTLRTGGVSQGGFASLNLAGHVDDDPAAVAENRKRLREALALPGEPLWLHQVHGTRIVNAREAGVAAQADGSWTDEVGVVCAVLTADCLPILLCDQQGRTVAAVHAGWRGLAAGVIPAAVEAMAVGPAELLAWVGPGISAPAYEVDEQVYEGLGADDAAAQRCFTRGRAGHWQCDLFAVAALHLQRAGVDAVFGGGFCTFDDPRFYSYRRDGQNTGRMATLIWRER